MCKEVLTVVDQVLKDNATEVKRKEKSNTPFR